MSPAPQAESQARACVETSMKRNFLVATVVGFLLTSFAPALAEEPPLSACAAGAVKAVQTRYEAVGDLRASFEQESRSVAFGGAAPTSTSRGEVVFAKPGRMRWNYSAPEESLVVSDGEWMWIYDPAAREAQKLPVMGGALSGAAVQFLLGEGDLAADFRIAELSCEEDVVRLELVPREPAAYESLRIAVDARRGDLRETEVSDLLGNVTRVRFDDIQVDTKPAADLFRFEPPDGVEVIELAPFGE